MAGAKAYLHANFHLDTSNHLATIHQCYRQTGQTVRQWSDSTGKTVLQMVAQKPKPGLVASYDIRDGNREGLFWFRRFINLSLTYLDTYRLTYSRGPTRGMRCRSLFHYWLNYLFSMDSTHGSKITNCGCSRYEHMTGHASVKG